MTKIKSRLVSRIFVVEAPGSADKALIMEVEIDCPACGELGYRLVGHHLRGLQRLIAEAVEAYPDLTGTESGIDVLHRMSFTGTSTPNPETN